jgi:hypothetical protein
MVVPVLPPTPSIAFLSRQLERVKAKALTKARTLKDSIRYLKE